MTIIADRYQLLEKLGQGGMGEVYRGLDMLTQAPVAVKNLRAINQWCKSDQSEKSAMLSVNLWSG